MSKEIRPSFLPVAKGLQDVIYHELDVITDSDWFKELVDERVKEALKIEQTCEECGHTLLTKIKDV
tara:strand:+ start:542 stop:739 length:198 start_codon:yes stop_codon:yes gene_type:complete